MEKNDLKYFELNSGVLKDFDKIMTMHLDYVEELKVSDIGTNSKLLNIVSLCTNIKTLIIEGDQRLNINLLIANICKPEFLENVILKNVKLPNGHTLKKFVGLKNISLYNIRFANIGTFLKEIPTPENIEQIKIYNSDLGKSSIKIMKIFENIKKIELVDVVNCKFEELYCLTLKNNLEELIIKNGYININEINSLLLGNVKKSIDCEITSELSFKIKEKFKIDEAGKSKIIINSSHLDNLVKNVNICDIDKLTLILESTLNIEKYIKILGTVRENLNIVIKDVSLLSKKDAQELNVETIDVLSAHGDEIEYSYKVKDYILLKEEIEKYTNQIPENISNVEKFLKLYKLLLDNIIVDDNFEKTTQKLDNLKNVLVEKKCLSCNFSKILYNCLSCINIESIVIMGTLIETNRKHTWNQVKIDNNWYNTDIALDSVLKRNKNILKRNLKYCLISDKSFYETHMPSTGGRNYAENDFSKKEINVYFLTGIYSDKLFKAYFKNVKDRIKILSKLNKQKALPEITQKIDNE